MSAYEWNSFTAKLYISGYSLDCKAGFQYIKNSSSSGITTGGGRTNQGAVYSGDVHESDLLATDYLYANTCANAVATLLHFEYVGGEGKYRITCKDSNAGQYLGMSNLGYMRAYHSENDNTHFFFRRNDGPPLNLNDLPEGYNKGLTMYSRHGDVNLYEKTYMLGSQHQWAAYLGSRTNGDSLSGRFDLMIIERNVAKL